MNLRSTCQLTGLTNHKVNTSYLKSRKDMICLTVQLKTVTMKPILILLIILALAPLGANANEAANHSYKSTQFFKEVQQLPEDFKKDFVVDYLLDEDGKPYIISIKSKNELMTALVQKMFSSESNIQRGQQDGWFIITFLYEQIQ